MSPIELTAQSPTVRRSRVGVFAASILSRLPQGKTLPPDVWRTRHRFMLGVIWLHVAALGIAGLVIHQSFGTLSYELGPIAACGLAAALPTGGRRLRGSMVAFGALYCSAALVNMAHGATEAHFHFFVMVAMLAAYEEWVPYLIAIAFVLFDHGVAGVLAPKSVYSDPSAIAHPWKWALIHAGFVVGLSVVNIIGWSSNERVRADAADAHERTRVSEAEFRDAFEDAPIGMAIADLDGRFVRVNRALAELSGFTHVQLLALRLADLLGPVEGDWLGDRDESSSFECELMRADGSTGSGFVQRSAVQGAARDHVLLQILDITAQKLAAEQLTHSAEHDVLTGLPNRALFERSVAGAIGALGPERSLAILFVDLDNFKLINDSLGHGAGDRLLVLVAQRLRGALDPADVVARFGGDEFVVLLPESDPDRALATARRLRAELSRPCDLDGQRRVVTASVGVTLSNRPDTTATALIRDGDAAMYRAKASGKNSDVLFDEELRGAALRRLELETALRSALERGELELHYQLAVDLESDAVFGVEAQLCWLRSGGAMISPHDFLPIAERSGLIVPIGRWVLDEACRQAAAWRAEGILGEDALMCVDLSQLQLTRGDTAADVGSALARHGLPAHVLCLEVTEGAVMLDPDRANRTLAALKRLGVKLAIDDFGAGYSSLSHIKHLMPVDIVKIDRSFVEGLGGRLEDAAVITAIVELADKLGLTTVAEGIEQGAQLDALRHLRCMIGQGAGIAQPEPAALFAQRLAGARRQHRAAA